MTILVDALANEIRKVDGRNDLGAGALAEKLLPFFESGMKKTRELALREAASIVVGGGIPQAIIALRDKDFGESNLILADVEVHQIPGDPEP